MHLANRTPSAVRLTAFTAALTAALTAAAGCGGDSGSSPPANETQVADFVSQVMSADLQTTATLREGERPGAQGTGSTLNVTSNAAAILGGSSQVALQASAAFTRVIVGVEGSMGYYELTLPAAVTSTGVVITLPQDLPRSGFNVVYGIADAAGSVAAYRSAPVSVETVGTGDVQVSVSWTEDSDVDLHVIDPSGEEIFYGHRVAQSGGELDLDSNPACRLDNKRNENVTFPAGRAPHGEYIVLVDYWSNCDVAETNYLVTVNIGGRLYTTKRDKLTGEGDQGGEGSGTEVLRFSYP
jgi:hypothetical protein